MLVQGFEITNVSLAYWNEHPFESLGLFVRVGGSLFLLLSNILGGILMAGIISFEINGSDPQKRGLFNQVRKHVTTRRDMSHNAIFQLSS